MYKATYIRRVRRGTYRWGWHGESSKRVYWRKQTALYKLNEPLTINVNGFLTCTEYVIVSGTPITPDHGGKETMAWAANKDGSLFGGFTDKSSPDKNDWFFIERPWDLEKNLPGSVVVGSIDHRQCLAQLGYELEGE